MSNVIEQQQRIETRQDKKVAKVIASAPALSTFVAKDARYLEYCVTEKTITIRDKGGHFGHISIYLPQSSLDWDKLTVNQVVGFLHRWGASKVKAMQLRKRRHFIYYS